MEICLTKLKNGACGVITSIRFSRRIFNMIHPRGHAHRRSWHARDSTMLKRLTDMGLTPGTKITMVKSALFHGPIELIVRGSRLAIGRGMARRIFVEVNG